MLGDEFETLRKHSTPRRHTEEEHDHYQFTAPAEDDQMVMDVYLSEEEEFTQLTIWHRTNIGYNALFNVLEVFYPVKDTDAIWAGDSESYERREPSGDWGDDSLHTFELYREGYQWDFDIEWRDMSHERTGSTPFDFELTVYDGFYPTTDSGSFDPIEKVLPVMMRDDSPLRVKRSYAQRYYEASRRRI